MSPSELHLLESLLSRALPDPRGFTDRVLEQLLDRLAAEPPVGRPVTVVQEPARRPSDHEVVLAAALGACECWGDDPRCDLCRGNGSPGWTDPDEQLYDELVTPAVQRWASATTSRPQTGPPDEAAPQDGVRR